MTTISAIALDQQTDYKMITVQGHSYRRNTRRLDSDEEEDTVGRFERILIFKLLEQHRLSITLFLEAQPIVEQCFEEDNVFDHMESFDPLEHLLGS